jgi:FkbM family methyltransferase
MPINFLPGRLPSIPRPPSSDPAELESVLWNGFPDGELAFDVGANTGQSLWNMVEHYDTVVAFEPAHESFRALRQSWGTVPDVVLCMEAVSDHEGTLETSMRESQLPLGQLVATEMPYKKFVQGITPVTESLPWGREIGTRTVPCRTLDSLAVEYGTPDMIKIDTEGHEAQILQGAQKIMEEKKTGFLVEFHLFEWYSECITIFGKAGYGPEVIRHPHYQPNSPLWVNHGWIKAEAPR